MPLPSYRNQSSGTCFLHPSLLPQSTCANSLPPLILRLHAQAPGGGGMGGGGGAEVWSMVFSTSRAQALEMVVREHTVVAQTRKQGLSPPATSRWPRPVASWHARCRLKAIPRRGDRITHIVEDFQPLGRVPTLGAGGAGGGGASVQRGNHRLAHRSDQ